MGAVLIAAFGGGVEMLAPTPESGGEGALGGVIEEADLHTGGVQPSMGSSSSVAPV